MLNYKLVLCYNGKQYAGFQIQPKADLRTIAGTLTDALSTIYKSNIKIVAAGRTDAGVHASGQVVNYTTDLDIEPVNIKKALNSILPDDIQVLKLETTHSNFLNNPP